MLPDGLLLIIKENTEENVSGSKNLLFLEWIIYILNILLFAVPILYSLIQDAYSYVADKLAGRKYSAEQVPGAGDQQVCDFPPLPAEDVCISCRSMFP